MMFILFQYKKLYLALELSGGTPMLIDTKSDDNVDLVQSGSAIVIEPPEISSKIQELYDQMEDLLKKYHHKTLITIIYVW